MHTQTSIRSLSRQLPTLFATVLCLVAPASGQSGPVTVQAGRAISLNLLSDLTNPMRTRFQVGIVVPNGCLGMLVSAKGAAAAVDYIAGKGNDSVCAQAIRQIMNPVAETASRFLITRKAVNSANCPALAAAIAGFYSVLEADLSRPVSLTGPAPPRNDRRVTTSEIRYTVQLAVNDATLSLSPKGEYQPPLQKALDQLHGTASDCANKVKESVEERYLFDGADILMEVSQ